MLAGVVGSWFSYHPVAYEQGGHDSNSELITFDFSTCITVLYQPQIFLMGSALLQLRVLGGFQVLAQFLSVFGE